MLEILGLPAVYPFCVPSCIDLRQIYFRLGLLAFTSDFLALHLRCPETVHRRDTEGDCLLEVYWCALVK